MESTSPTSGRIRPLSPQLANQIAAGEVVERPASVLKELLENSLDAGASRIEIEVEQGGVSLLRVRDNGSGMPEEDLPLALCRHATSKIHDSEDLLHIHSLGFRGEALASIGSIARVALTSATSGAAHAWTLSCEAGEMSPPAPAAHPPGTTVEVRDLFFNTPARRKFLRTDKTEFSHIDDVVRRVALSRFDVALSLQHNGRQVHRLAPANDAPGQTRRVARLFGQSFLDQSFYLEDAASGLQLQGWLARPSFSRSQADLQYFYVNGRMIRDRVISHAVRQSYQDGLYPGRQPAYILHLAIDPARVDVNVHPTKHEVRFRETRLVHDFLYRSLRHAMAQAVEAAAAHPQAPSPAGAMTASSGSVSGPMPAQMPAQVPGQMPAPARRPDQRTGTEAVRGTARSGAASGVAEAFSGYLALHGRTDGMPEVTESGGACDAQTQRGVSRIPVGRFVVVNAQTGPRVVDLDAVRISDATARLYAVWRGDEPSRARPLLVPRSVTAVCGEDEAHGRCLGAVREALAATGLAFEILEVDSGSVSVMLRAVPTLLAEADTVAMMHSLIALVAALPTTDAVPPVLDEQAQQRCLDCLAQHAADAPVASLTPAEVNRLVHLAGVLAATGQDAQGRRLWRALSAQGLACLFEHPADAP